MLITSIVVLWVGRALTARIPVLDRFSIPPAVTGGLLCSGIVALIQIFGDVQVTFDARLRDMLLLVFFSTIGLSSKFRDLAAGGRGLAVLVVVASVFLVVQDLSGVGLVWLIGGHPAYGLFGGSVSFAGGFGTAIAWGDIAVDAGLVYAREIGIACATVGLIAGGLAGGPIAQWLIRRNGLEAGSQESSAEAETRDRVRSAPWNVDETLGTVFALALCASLGDIVNRALFSGGVVLPGFLTAMGVGIDRVSQISLPLFLAMSLMGMQLWVIANAAGAILLVLTVQVVVMTGFAVLVVFRTMGRDYDAAVIAAGFVGLGLGATPVGIANMEAVTKKYGPSAKAFLIVPLVGAFFIDVVNATVIKFFAGLPIIANTPIP
ncbi:MAG: sodium/glutamate symporter [Deltaproteobacteria bacterium]|nr:sodium/glutamate symporter [Deltaproteobacteria bacterium]